MLADPSVTRFDRIDLPLVAFDWPFRRDRDASIMAHFEQERRRTPAIWNGHILLSRNMRGNAATLTGDCFRTDFAGMLAWRAWDWPDRTVFNGFGQGALLTADGAFLMGVMGRNTVNRGKVFFAAGTPDESDIRDGRLDMMASIFRELTEETGFTADDVTQEGPWIVVRDAQRLAFNRVLRLSLTVDQALERFAAFHAAEDDPELAGLVAVRGPADIVPAMPPFVPLFLRHYWGA
jgi:8-oxo-dGTP pyrophosphatase MutT (NUDIX family)